jgi:hypothetical protein
MKGGVIVKTVINGGFGSDRATCGRAAQTWIANGIFVM